ncbi:hypothetical protein IWQ62_002181 [Dispira parvispora]|uniref:Zn(2)-C6 fungal-type domain-containing protein n=1 Tax=Dispira parvispora TaxID=1520584 RepID=A0A9W8ARW9_9FUNG|nr:hypothetical protein IWQ62_002181 [Dispira parvispora]
MGTTVLKTLPLRRIPVAPAAKAKAACDFCRVKKRKCDRVLTGCTTCQQHCVPCEYGLTPAKRRRYETYCARRQAALVPLAKLSPAPLLPTDTFTDSISAVASSRTPSLSPERISTLPILPTRDNTLPLLPLIIVGNIERLQDISFSHTSTGSITWEITTQFLRRLNLTTGRCPSSAGKLTTSFSEQALVDTSTSTIDRPDDIDEWLNMLADRYALLSMTRSSSSSPDPTSPPLVHRDSQFDHYAHVANRKPTPPRSLFRLSDLMFHSDVIHYHVYVVTHLYTLEAEKQHYQRLLHRLSTRTFPIPLMVSLLNMIAALSNHPVFRGLAPSETGLAYHQHLQGLIPFCLEQHDSDLVTALLFSSKGFFGRGLLSLGFSVVSAMVSKCQQWRLHLLDHPHRHALPKGQSNFPNPLVEQDEVLREHYRILWWSAFGEEAIICLIFSSLPLVDMETMAVDISQESETLHRTMLDALHDSSSPLFCSSKYPVRYFSSWVYDGIVRIDLELLQIAHLVAKARYIRSTEPDQWNSTWPMLVEKLGRWFETQESKACHLISYSSANYPYKWKPRLKEYHSRGFIFYYTITIYLHYHSTMLRQPFTSGKVVDSIEPSWSTSLTDPRVWTPQGHAVCWRAVVQVRRIMNEFFMIPVYVQNSEFVGCLYASALVCLETWRHTSDQVTVKWAKQFVKEIIDFFTQYGQFWIINLRIARIIVSLRDQVQARATQSNPTPPPFT